MGYHTLTHDVIATHADEYTALDRYDVDREFAQRWSGPQAQFVERKGTVTQTSDTDEYTIRLIGVTVLDTNQQTLNPK